MPKTDFKFHTSLRVRWMECDGQGIVYNGAYMDYVEVGQSDYYRNLGFSIYKIAECGYFDTAVVKVTLEYKAPARVEDLLDIYMRVARLGNTSITMQMEIYPQGVDKLRASGEIIYVGYDVATGTTRPIPEELRALVSHHEKNGVALPLEQFPYLAEAAARSS